LLLPLLFAVHTKKDSESEEKKKGKQADKTAFNAVGRGKSGYKVRKAKTRERKTCGDEWKRSGFAIPTRKKKGGMLQSAVLTVKQQQIKSEKKKLDRKERESEHQKNSKENSTEVFNLRACECACVSSFFPPSRFVFVLLPCFLSLFFPCSKLGSLTLPRSWKHLARSPLR
jgi:uncharacterized protein YqhQ